VERLTIYSAALIVVGDLTSTSMMRPTTTPSSCSIFCHLSTHDLQQQRVNSPTYPQGHTLDVFIARNDQPVDMLSIHPLLLSDHPCVVADSTVSYRPVIVLWRAFDVVAFAEDLRRSELVTSVPADVDASSESDCYSTTWPALLDKHAPLTMKRAKER